MPPPFSSPYRSAFATDVPPLASPGRFFRLGGRGRGRQLSDDLLGDQLVAGGGEMDAVDAAQTLRHPDAVLAIGRVLSVLVGDDGP